MPAVLRSVRTRILASCLVLLAFSMLASVIVVRQLLLVRLDHEVEQTLIQETLEFRQLVGGRDPSTGRPFGADLGRIFQVFLERNVPGNDEGIITLLGGRTHESIGGRRFPLEAIARSEEWAEVREPLQREVDTSVGPARYIVVPVELGGRVRGHFAVVAFLREDREGLEAAVQIAAGVSLAVLLIASGLAWFAAGRALAPVRVLRQTARSITETDLSRRIEVDSGDELADLARTFNEMLDRLQTAFQAQRDFVNDASHELRTPITIVRGHLELMGDGPGERRETVELVNDELDRMARMVDDLLLLAKAERRDFLRVENVDLAAFGRELHTKASVLATRDWRLELDGHGDLGIDRQRMTQAVMNLVDNAVQHTADGDPITIAIRAAEGRVRLSVTDSGPGVPHAMRDYIFERFARGDEGPRGTSGVGLGLAIVRVVALAHGGDVGVSSAPAAGATFTIDVPASDVAGARPTEELVT